MKIMLGDCTGSVHVYYFVVSMTGQVNFAALNHNEKLTNLVKEPFKNLLSLLHDMDSFTLALPSPSCMVPSVARFLLTVFPSRRWLEVRP